MTPADLQRIERKLDLILDALGLGGKPQMTPVQQKDFVRAEVLKFQEKRRKKREHDCQEG